MSNEEMFNRLVKHDYERVGEYLNKGYTDTSEWKERLEDLYCSLEVLLKDMNGEIKYA